MSTTREKALNRARVARHTQRRQDRRAAVIADVLRYMKREKVLDDHGKLRGYYVTFDYPDEAADRFEKLAQEHGKTAKQLMDLALTIYFEEAQRLKDEQN